MSAWSGVSARYLTNRWWIVHQIYQLGAVSNSDEVIRFWGQKIKGRGPDGRNMVQYALYEAYLTNRSREFHQIHNLRAVWNKDELVRFWGRKVKRSRSQTTFSVEAYRSTVRRRRPSSWILLPLNLTDPWPSLQ